LSEVFENRIIFNTFAMKYSELKRLLKKSGCYFVRQGGNHEMWYSPITKKQFPVCRHDSEEVYVKTLASIIRQSGVEL